MTVTGGASRIDSLDFGLEYDGPGLANHEMDVRDLAPALLSAGNLLQTLNRLLHPTDPEVQVNIRATSEGSFVVHLNLLYDHGMNVLNNRGLQASEGLSGLLVALASLIAFVRKRGQAGEPTEEATEGGVVRLTWSDGQVLEMPIGTFRLVDNSTVRRPLAEVVRPIGQEGIDFVRFIRDGIVVEEVDSDSLPAFRIEGGDEGRILNTWDREMYLRILTSAWQVGRKWRFTDGRWPFWAAIEDERFNERLASGERFGAHDLLHCMVREVQWQDEAGLHSEITVIHVMDRQDAADQPTLGTN